jgi:hypothetical protein
MGFRRANYPCSPSLQKFKSGSRFGKVGEGSFDFVSGFYPHPDVIKNLGRGQCVMIGKIPRAWHVIVAVYPPGQQQTAIDAGQVTEILRRTKETIEREPSGFVALSLRARTRELLDYALKRSAPAAGMAEMPSGLRVGRAAEAKDEADAIGDDRF